MQLRATELPLCLGSGHEVKSAPLSSVVPPRFRFKSLFIQERLTEHTNTLTALFVISCLLQIHTAAHESSGSL